MPLIQNRTNGLQVRGAIGRRVGNGDRLVGFCNLLKQRICLQLPGLPLEGYDLLVPPRFVENLCTRVAGFAAIDNAAANICRLLQLFNGNLKDFSRVERLANGRCDGVDQTLTPLLRCNGTIGFEQLILPRLQVRNQPLGKGIWRNSRHIYGRCANSLCRLSQFGL